MSISYKEEGEILVVKFPSEPDLTDFKQARAIVSKKEQLKEIHLDLKDLFFLQSKFVAELIALKKLSVSKSARLVLLNVQEGVVQMLEISHLIDHFTLNKDFRSYSPGELVYLLLDPELNEAVIEYIASNFNNTFLTLVKQYFETDDPLLIESAIFIAGKTHCHELTSYVKKCLKSPYPNVVRASILVLGWFGDESIKQEIYPFLKDEHIDVAEAAAATIALLADEKDSIVIGDFLKSNDERVRRIAIQALSLINDDISYNYLVEHLKKEKDETLRVQLAKSISSFNKPDVPDLLLKMLTEDSLRIREAAASSLVRIKATDKIDRILALVSDNDVWVAYFAVKAVGELCKSRKCSDALIEKYSSVDTQVKIAIIEALGKMDIDYSDFIFQLMDDENEDIRKEALNTLFNMNKKVAVEAAYGALKDQSWIVRFKAVEILEKLKPEGCIEKLKKVASLEDNRYVREKILSIVGEL